MMEEVEQQEPQNVSIETRAILVRFIRWVPVNGFAYPQCFYNPISMHQQPARCEKMGRRRWLYRGGKNMLSIAGCSGTDCFSYLLSSSLTPPIHHTLIGGGPRCPCEYGFGWRCLSVVVWLPGCVVTIMEVWQQQWQRNEYRRERVERMSRG